MNIIDVVDPANKMDAVEPANEMILYYYGGGWDCHGPMTASEADEFVRQFHEIGIPAFICLWNEFRKKGVPRQRYAHEYFDPAFDETVVYQ